MLLRRPLGKTRLFLKRKMLEGGTLGHTCTWVSSALDYFIGASQRCFFFLSLPLVGFGHFAIPKIIWGWRRLLLCPSPPTYIWNIIIAGFFQFLIVGDALEDHVSKEGTHCARRMLRERPRCRRPNCLCRQDLARWKILHL